MKGIDISHWNGNINFQRVKNAGIQFVIIKAGGSDSGNGYKDSMFETNYTKAKAAGLYVGTYYFVGKQFITKENGIADAKKFYDIIKGKTFTMPVCLDLEATSPANKTGATEATVAFCDYMESLGYYATIYSSTDSGFQERLDCSKLTAFDKWVASWKSTKPTYPDSFGMWQYSSKGNVDGIEGNVDLDYAYKDYPSIIKSMKTVNTLKEEMWNQYVEIAREVIKGRFGDGETRVKLLEAAGYDYDWVQKIVNYLLSE